MTYSLQDFLCFPSGPGLPKLPVLSHSTQHLSDWNYPVSTYLLLLPSQSYLWAMVSPGDSTVPGTY